MGLKILRYVHEATAPDRKSVAWFDLVELGLVVLGFVLYFLVRGGVGLYTQQHLLGYINKVQLEGPDGTFMISLAPGAALMPTVQLAMEKPRRSIVTPPA